MNPVLEFWEKVLNTLFPDADRARKHGMEEFISADPCKFDHSALFKTLQTLTMDYRLNDPYCSLVSVWFRKAAGLLSLDIYCDIILQFVLILGLVQSWTSIRTRRVLC